MWLERKYYHVYLKKYEHAFLNINFIETNRYIEINKFLKFKVYPIIRILKQNKDYCLAEIESSYLHTICANQVNYTPSIDESSLFYKKFLNIEKIFNFFNIKDFSWSFIEYYGTGKAGDYR